MAVQRRLEYETRRLEDQLNPEGLAWHQAVGQGTPRYGAKRYRWISASIALREQERPLIANPLSVEGAQSISQELADEVRAIESDYGNLCLEGQRLFFAVLAFWLLFQDALPFRLNILSLTGLYLATALLYPIVVYSYGNLKAVHPFKVLKLGLGAAAALLTEVGIWFLGMHEKSSSLLGGVILAPFNITEFLILVNGAIWISFVIYYRRMNLYSDLAQHYPIHVVALSGLSETEREKVNRLMRQQEVLPLKTQVRRQLKTVLLETAVRAGTVESTQVQAFIRDHCIRMNWIYWSGTAIQGSVLILLISKLIWAWDNGLVVSSDYFRQGLTTGMVLGAILLSLVVICPGIRCFRELLYRGSAFTMTKVWQMMGLALLAISIILMNGLVPSRFVWGTPVNPAPHPWGLALLLGLVLLVQFIKVDHRPLRLDNDKK